MTTQKITVYKKTLAVQWGDLDALGHVNNVRYFDYFQEARIEWLLAQGMHMSGETGPVVVQVGCSFLKPLFYPATVTIECHMHSIGRSSFIIDNELYQDGQLMAEGSSKIVWVDFVKNKSVPLPEFFRNMR